MGMDVGEARDDIVAPPNRCGRITHISGHKVYLRETELQIIPGVG